MMKRKAGIAVMSLIITVMMTANAFAVSGAADSDRTDYNTNRTGNSTAVRQANSSETGTIRLGKILTVNQSGKFPNIEDFVYKITPVAAWDNANVKTSKSGKAVSQANMPRPAASSTAHHSITVISPDSVDNAPWSALVSLGNFRNGNENNTSSKYGDRRQKHINSDDPSNTYGIDEGRRRTRVTDVSFRFSRAGYYMYRIEEAGSRPNGGADSLSDLRKDVAGVDYDNNTYYVVFYVCNREAAADNKADEYGRGTKKGDTCSGVYVHTITSWTNNAGTDYKPDNTMRSSDGLADAENWLNDLMLSQDVDSKYSTGYGDGGHPAKPNTGRVENNNAGGPSDVTHDNPGKVGISSPDDPDFLEAYRMWNGQITHDVVLKKNVTGNLGDLSKEFIFSVTITGLENGQTYTTDIPSGSTEETSSAGIESNDVTSAGVKLYDMEPPECLAADGKSFTADKTGTVKFRVKLKDGDVLVLNALPMAASYQVTEEASDHVAQYNIVSTNKNGKAVFCENSHTPGGNDAAHLGKANSDPDSDLSTEIEFVDRFDGTVTILFQNNRDIATLTGIAGLDYAVYAASIAVLSALSLIVIRRRREYDEEEYR